MRVEVNGAPTFCVHNTFNMFAITYSPMAKTRKIVQSTVPMERNKCQSFSTTRDTTNGIGNTTGNCVHARISGCTLPLE
eukprot:TRINITY_DN1138_c0_g1_i1.p2 TRINITY_DN1138_c0_g1~~TRINITY_DN1138_c0_g1_i1.p2  ORF type:complete len:79 (+),score=1.41 TRINITY_DN1138_c0_g1_i1:380-616(+)